MSNVRLFSRVFAGFAALALMVGCGGGAPPPAIVVTITSPSSTPLVAGGSETFTVTVANDPNSAGVTWSITSGGGTLSAITATSVTYTAPTPVTTATAVITATSKSDTSKVTSFTVTLTPIAVTSTTTPVVMIAGASQTFTVTVTGDTTLNAGVTWSITSGGGTLSAITATSVTYTAPTPVTSITAVITATSKTDPSKTVTFTVTLTPISVAITTTPVAMVAGATQTFAATVSNDITPSAGVTWSASVGTITAAGVYTAPTPVATATATITATSKTDTTKSSTATVTLTPIAVTIPTTPTAIPGAGTEAITATVSGDQTLNAGVTWSITSGGGTLTAVTTTSVTYTAPLPVTTANAVITATSKTDTTKTATITIPLTPISVGAITPATVNLGTSSTQAFTGAAVANDSSNSGVTWSINPASGAGTIVAATGVYSAPTTVISSATTVTVTATSVKDPTKSATATITLQPITIGAISPATVTLNGGGTQTFTGAALTYDGSNSGVTWSISPASGAGTIVSTTGAYTAPAVVSGTSPVTVTVTATSVKDTSKTTTATITLNPISVTLTTSNSISVDGNGANSDLVKATIANDNSAAGATFVVSGPGGGTMSASPVAGNSPSSIYTAPSGIVTATSATITVASVTDNSKTQQVAVTINPPMSFTTPQGALTAATTNTAYAGATIVVAGGTGTKTFTITSGSLPTGLTMSAAGVISGTVTGGTGTYNFTIHVTDQATNSALIAGSFSITVTVAPLVFTAPSAPVTLPTATVGTAITPYTVATTGGTGTVTYSLNSGTLPAGLSLNGSTGVISGTPTAPTVVAGTVVTIKATDSATPTPATLVSSNITIIVNPVLLVVNVPTLPTGFVGSAYNGTGYQFTSTGGTGAITWTMTPGNIDGLTLSTGGLLTGTPNAAFSSTISVTATDSATNQQQTKTITPSLTVSNALTITTNQSSLPNAYNGLAYTPTTLVAAGGTSPYTWSVTSGLTGTNSLQTLNLAVSSAGVITGTPATTGTANFTVKVTDSATPTANTTTATYTITAYTPLSLPTPNPSTLPAATTTASYTGSIVAVGGVGPTYTWTVNSSNANTGSVNLGNGTMQAASSGTNTLNITGTPTTTGTISFTASVKDSAGTTFGPTTYTIAVSTTYTVGGAINVTNGCGVSTLPTFTVTLTQGSTTIGTATTNSSGNFAIANVPNGVYTITPSITGPSSVFYPTTLSATVNNANFTSGNFFASLGYTVSGTVAYTGSHTVSQANPIYLSLGNCGGNGNPGTSLSATGAFTIHGVQPGNYTLSAFQDNLGYGSQNASNPVGSASVNVVTSNVTNASVTLTDPSSVTLSSAPTLQGVAAFNNGVIAQYKAITNSNNTEMPTSYTLQWSTTSTFTAIAGSMTFPATGGGGANIWFVNKDLTTGCTNCSTLASGTYFFRAFATAGSSTSPFGVFSSSGNPVAVTMGAPTGGVTVSGSVTYPGTATGPLYVGFYNYSTGVFYGEYIQNPSSAQAYSVQVPIASTYYFVAVIDSNKDGVVDAGDLNDVNNSGSPPTVSITAATSNENLTLTGTNSLLTTYTGHNIQSGQSDNYSVNANVRPGLKLPIAAELISATNPDVIVPQDIALCTNCGNHQFQLQDSTQSTIPVVNDSYGIKVTYSDGTSDASLPATVNAVLTSTAAATSLSPTTGGSVSTTPSFSWTYPTNAGNYTYQFWINPQNGGNNIWQIPGSNSNSNNFTNSQITPPLVWGVDPTNSSNTPTGPLTLGSAYSWTIESVDTNNNYVQVTANYTP